MFGVFFFFLSGAIFLQVENKLWGCPKTLLGLLLSQMQWQKWRHHIDLFFCFERRHLIFTREKALTKKIKRKNCHFCTSVNKGEYIQEMQVCILNDQLKQSALSVNMCICMSSSCLLAFIWGKRCKRARRNSRKLCVNYVLNAVNIWF